MCAKVIISGEDRAYCPRKPRKNRGFSSRALQIPQCIWSYPAEPGHILAIPGDPLCVRFQCGRHHAMPEMTRPFAAFRTAQDRESPEKAFCGFELQLLGYRSSVHAQRQWIGRAWSRSPKGTATLPVYKTTPRTKRLPTAAAIVSRPRKS